MSPAPGPKPDRAVVARLRKSARGEIVVALFNSDGVTRVDVRVFAEFANASEPVPTASGFSVPVDRLAELIEALRAAAKVATRRTRGDAPKRPLF